MKLSGCSRLRTRNATRPLPAQTIPEAASETRCGRQRSSLKQISAFRLGFTDIGGWDHHVNEGAAEGQLANVLREFAQSIAAFWIDLGPLAQETVIVTMSDIWTHRARENGNRGTDHGHANVMFVLGGPVRGGHVYGRWPGLEQAQLYEGRDLALTTDFRPRAWRSSIPLHLGNQKL